jgi:cold shock protein
MCDGETRKDHPKNRVVDMRFAAQEQRCVRADLEETRMPIGTVKWFNATKGYGFIEPSDGGKDVFVHITAVEKAGLRALVEGQKLTFDVVTERGKTAAANLRAA